MKNLAILFTLSFLAFGHELELSGYFLDKDGDFERKMNVYSCSTCGKFCVDRLLQGSVEKSGRVEIISDYNVNLIGAVFTEHGPIVLGVAYNIGTKKYSALIAHESPNYADSLVWSKQLIELREVSDETAKSIEFKVLPQSDGSYVVYVKHHWYAVHYNNHWLSEMWFEDGEWKTSKDSRSNVIASVDGRGLPIAPYVALKPQPELLPAAVPAPAPQPATQVPIQPAAPTPFNQAKDDWRKVGNTFDYIHNRHKLPEGP